MYECNRLFISDTRKKLTHMNVLEIFLGLSLAAGAAWLVRIRFPYKDHAFWRMGLLVAACIYLLFATWGLNGQWLLIEAAGVLLYGVFAWLSKRYALWWLAIGWGLHPLWDVLLHGGGHLGFVPAWYPGVCLGFDLLIGGYILWLYYERKGAAAPRQNG